MNTPVVFRRRAALDVAVAARWYDDRGRGLGEAFLRELARQADIVSENPRLHAPVRDAVRRALMHRFPYGIFYLVEPTRAVILRVLHNARDPAIWPGRNGPA